MSILVFFLTLIVPATHAVVQEPLLSVELRKAEDSGEVVWTGRAAVVIIASKSGIGGVRLVRGSDEWPSQLTIRLKLAGLESFRMDNGLIRFGTSLMSPKRVHYWNIAKDGRPSEHPDGTIEVTVTKTEDAVEILVPIPMTKDNPDAISCSWVDFFRK